MNVRIVFVAVLSLVLAGCSGHPQEPVPTSSGYAGLLDSPIRGLTPAQIQELRAGAGMQLALPAELNGYPGPKHVLELAGALSLNESQRAATQALYNETNQKARSAGEQVLAAYEAIDQWFRAGNQDPAELESLMTDLGQREAALRQVHLAAHIECKDLLTAHQLELYKELRGYGTGDHSSHH